MSLLSERKDFSRGNFGTCRECTQQGCRNVQQGVRKRAVAPTVIAVANHVLGLCGCAGV